MVPDVIYQTIKQVLTRVTVVVDSMVLLPVSGGSINQTYQVLDQFHAESFFCKINSATHFPLLFEKEKSGLKILADQHVIRIPRSIACEVTGDTQILVLEWIDQGPKTKAFWKLFGEQVARLHHCSAASFGLHEDNYMGALAQSNLLCDNWVDFFIHQRIAPLTRRAMDNHLLDAEHIRHFENLYKQLPQFISADAAHFTARRSMEW